MHLTSNPETLAIGIAIFILGIFVYGLAAIYEAVEGEMSILAWFFTYTVGLTITTWGIHYILFDTDVMTGGMALAWIVFSMIYAAVVCGFIIYKRSKE